MSTVEHNLRVDYVEFPGRDLQAIKAFYTEVFDWKFEDYGPGYAAFFDGRLSGGFFKSEDEVRTGSALVVIYATELEQIQDKVQAAGGQISKGIFHFPGGRRFHFLDPSGNELAVWSNI